MEPSTQRIWRKYWYRALFVAWWLRFVPYVRLVGLNGSMMTGLLHEGSDIDFFIIAKRGHIFTARILSTTLVKLLGLHRTPHHVAGRICLNRYAADDYLQISPRNLYHAWVFHNLYPLAGEPYFARAFSRANRWMAVYGLSPQVPRPFWQLGFARIIQAVLEVLLHPWAAALERRAAAWQRNRAAHDTRVNHPESVVVLTDDELRFHLAKHV